jgi:hypothetical protein
VTPFRALIVSSGFPLETGEPCFETGWIAAARSFNRSQPKQANNQARKADNRSHVNDSSCSAL